MIKAKTYLCRQADQSSWGMAARVHQLYGDYHLDTCSGLATALDYRQTLQIFAADPENERSEQSGDATGLKHGYLSTSE